MKERQFTARDNDTPKRTADVRQRSEKTESMAKRAYSASVLRVYGSVKELTLGPAGTTCDGVNSGSNQNKQPDGTCKSDRATKENIVRIGTHPLGIGLYLFDFKPEFRAQSGYGRQFGVMADEVEKVVPEAVVIHPDGYKMVDYAMLGISRTLH